MAEGKVIDMKKVKKEKVEAKAPDYILEREKVLGAEKKETRNFIDFWSMSSEVQRGKFFHGIVADIQHLYMRVHTIESLLKQMFEEAKKQEQAQKQPEIIKKA